MKAKFGKIDYYKLANGIDMPILEIETEEKTFYLSPFRCYRFQVSETFDGVGDCGSSIVIPFERYFVMDRSSLEEMIRGQIAVALINFSNTSYGNHCSLPGICGLKADILEKFIEETIDMWYKLNSK